MKKIKCSVFLMIILAFSFSLFSAENDLEFNRKLYSLSDNWAARYEIVKECYGTSQPEVLNEFFYEVLVDLQTDAKNLPTVTDQQFWDNTARIVCESLGKGKFLEAADVMWKIYPIAPSNELKTIILMAFGDMNAVNFNDHIVHILETLNMETGKDKQNAEMLAGGAIYALDILGQAESYRALFYAANGWYSNAVKKQADAALENLYKKIGSSVTEQINLLMVDPSVTLLMKQTALKRALELDLPASDIASIARNALAQSQGTVGVSADKNLRYQVSTLALTAMIDFKDTSVESVPYLEEAVKDTYGLDERIYAVRALGANGSPEAVRVLSDLVNSINEKAFQQLFRRDVEEDLLYETITALGQAGGEDAQKALSSIIAIDFYSAGIKRAAEEQLKNIM